MDYQLVTCSFPNDNDQSSIPLCVRQALDVWDIQLLPQFASIGERVSIEGREHLLVPANAFWDVIKVATNLNDFWETCGKAISDNVYLMGGDGDDSNGLQQGEHRVDVLDLYTSLCADFQYPPGGTSVNADDIPTEISHEVISTSGAVDEVLLHSQPKGDRKQRAAEFSRRAIDNLYPSCSTRPTPPVPLQKGSGSVSSRENSSSLAKNATRKTSVKSPKRILALSAVVRDEKEIAKIGLGFMVLNDVFKIRNLMDLQLVLSSLSRNMWLARESQWNRYVDESNVYWLKEAKCREAELVSDLREQEEEMSRLRLEKDTLLKRLREVVPGGGEILVSQSAATQLGKSSSSSVVDGAHVTSFGSASSSLSMSSVNVVGSADVERVVRMIVGLCGINHVMNKHRILELYRVFRILLPPVVPDSRAVGSAILLKKNQSVASMSGTINKARHRMCWRGLLALYANSVLVRTSSTPQAASGLSGLMNRSPPRISHVSSKPTARPKSTNKKPQSLTSQSSTTPEQETPSSAVQTSPKKRTSLSPSDIELPISPNVSTQQQVQPSPPPLPIQTSLTKQPSSGVLLTKHILMSHPPMGEMTDGIYNHQRSSPEVCSRSYMKENRDPSASKFQICNDSYHSRVEATTCTTSSSSATSAAGKHGKSQTVWDRRFSHPAAQSVSTISGSPSAATHRLMGNVVVSSPRHQLSSALSRSLSAASHPSTPPAWNPVTNSTIQSSGSGFQPPMARESFQLQHIPTSTSSYVGVYASAPSTSGMPTGRYLVANDHCYAPFTRGPSAYEHLRSSPATTYYSGQTSYIQQVDPTSPLRYDHYHQNSGGTAGGIGVVTTTRLHLPHEQLLVGKPSFCA